MVKKIIKTEKGLKEEIKTSWLKISIAVVAGIVLGYLILGPSVANITYEKISDLVVLSLLACILALLLDIRKIILVKICP